jgi:hypothetical protein
MDLGHAVGRKMFGLLKEVRWRLNPYGVDLESVVIGMEYLSEFYGPHWVGTPEALLTLISKIRPEARLPRTSQQLWRLLKMLAKVVTGRVTIDLDGALTEKPWSVFHTCLRRRSASLCS